MTVKNDDKLVPMYVQEPADTGEIQHTRFGTALSVWRHAACDYQGRLVDTCIYLQNAEKEWTWAKAHKFTGISGETVVGVSVQGIVDGATYQSSLTLSIEQATELRDKLTKALEDEDNA